MMKRTQVQLDPATYAAVRERAFETRRSISAVVRDALAQTFNVGRQPAASVDDFRFVGHGRSAQRAARPVSTFHDAALAEAYAAKGRRQR